MATRGKNDRRTRSRRYTDRRAVRTRRRRGDQIESSVLSVSGMWLLIGTKFADALTTGIGLLYVSRIYEQNPVARLMFTQFGTVTGLLLSSVVLIATIGVVTEVGAIKLQVRFGYRHIAPVVRVLGYGIPSVLFAAVAMYNTKLILQGFSLTDLLL